MNEKKRKERIKKGLSKTLPALQKESPTKGIFHFCFFIPIITMHNLEPQNQSLHLYHRSLHSFTTPSKAAIPYPFNWNSPICEETPIKLFCSILYIIF